MHVLLFRSTEGTLNRNTAVAGEASMVSINLVYNNIGRDPAFGTQIMFDLPENFMFIRVDHGPEIPPVSLHGASI